MKKPRKDHVPSRGRNGGSPRCPPPHGLTHTPKARPPPPSRPPPQHGHLLRIAVQVGTAKCIEWLVVPSRGPQVYEGQDALDCEVLPWRVPYIIKLRLAAEDAGAIMLTHVCPSSFFRRGATWMSRSHSAG